MPAAHEFHGTGITAGQPLAHRLHRLRRTRRHQVGRQVGQRGEHEEPLAQVRMGHLEPLGAGSGGVVAAVGRRPLDPDTVEPEEQQIQIEGARPPANARPPAVGPFERFEQREQRECPAIGIAASGDVQGRHGVVETWLVDGPHGPGAVEGRDAPKVRPGQDRERGDRRFERRTRGSQVGPQTHVAADEPLCHDPLP